MLCLVPNELETWLAKRLRVELVFFLNRLCKNAAFYINTK